MAEFITGYLQRAVALNMAVIGPVLENTEVTAANRNAAICTGDLVVFAAGTDGKPASITKATSLDVATHVVASNDSTMNYYVPTDIGDYRIKSLLGATGTELKTTTPVKKVALYPIWEKDDIVVEADDIVVEADGNDAGGE